MNSLKLFILYLFLWIILSGGKIELFPLAFIILMSILTTFVFQLNYHSICLKSTLKLLVFFFYYSFKGGLQVALFALKPKLKLQPFVYEHQLKSHNEFSASMLANIYSLMPGTVSMGYDKKILSLHILDQSLFDKELIDQFEQFVLDAFTKKEAK
jgi:multicomponent Na+:H+ antiporter subunit E